MTDRNILDVLNANAFIAVAAIGMTMIIVTGNIDISVGAAIGILVTLSGNVAVGLADLGLPLVLVNVIAWTVPILGGEFIIDRRFGYADGLMGGNLWFMGRDLDAALEAANRDLESDRQCYLRLLLLRPGLRKASSPRSSGSTPLPSV